MASQTTTHLVFVIDDDDFLERLRDEEVTAEELENYARDESPSSFGTSTEVDLDVHQLLAVLGLRWSEDPEVEDLDGVVKLLDENSAALAASKLEGMVEKPSASARRLATILAEEFSTEVDEEAIERVEASLAEQDARAVPEDDTETDAATQIVVQHLQALRTASELGLWLATASYVE